MFPSSIVEISIGTDFFLLQHDVNKIPCCMEYVSLKTFLNQFELLHTFCKM